VDAQLRTRVDARRVIRKSSGWPHKDRCFDADRTVRRLARKLYAETRELPIVSPHGHVDPRLLATNERFPEPTSLLITPDHYVLRMLYARGIPLEALGVPRRDGKPAAVDPRRAWQLFADNYFAFRATPTGMWLDHELHDVFGVRKPLDGRNALTVYDEINEKLASPEFLPRSLFERFHIELLATTDAADDRLEHHAAIERSGWKGHVIPTFRPDAVFRLAAPGWRDAIESFSRAYGAPIESAADLVRALERRRLQFKRRGALATDHAVLEPYTESVSDAELERLFRLGVAGQATSDDQRRFEGHLLIEMARMSVEDGLVMQLHAGAFRDHNQPLFEKFGPDRGGDIPVATEFTRNLRPLLNAFGNDTRFTLVLFTLDESTYSRELAPLAGHYPAVRLGAPWWFNDSVEGMIRFRERVTETAGIDKMAGFTDDTRAFCSIPARHDLARRVDANWLARLVSRHMISLADARTMARALAYDLAKKTYRVE
jgi:glucuronate isomerase